MFEIFYETNLQNQPDIWFRKYESVSFKWTYLGVAVGDPGSSSVINNALGQLII